MPAPVTHSVWNRLGSAKGLPEQRPANSVNFCVLQEYPKTGVPSPRWPTRRSTVSAQDVPVDVFAGGKVTGGGVYGGVEGGGVYGVHETTSQSRPRQHLSLIHISEPTRLGMISYAV